LHQACPKLKAIKNERSFNIEFFFDQVHAATGIEASTSGSCHLGQLLVLRRPIVQEI